MESVIYDPLKEYVGKYKDAHLKNSDDFLKSLVEQSGVNIEQNRETVRQYDKFKNSSEALTKKLNRFRVLRVLMCISVVLIPIVIWKTTPKIKALREENGEAAKKAAEFLDEAEKQMKPLNDLFTDRDALQIIEATIPMLSFAEYFSAKQENDMAVNYDFLAHRWQKSSALSVLAGSYNDNPFLFENELIHTMGTETYHGYKTIHWTKTYRDGNGKLQTRTETQTLHATVTKPKPFFTTQVVLNYCAQGGAELSFSRDASHLEQKSQKELERFVKKGEKRLKKKSDRAISENSNFTSMSNSDFEVIFDALDRTNEVEFRTLFTPLAQTNMVSLLLSKDGYGDDVNFFKRKRTNTIVTNHSQGRDITLSASGYRSYSYDIIKESFIGKNTSFFKAVYFDFAPVWAIPIYQERPVHSLKPLPDYSQLYSLLECEALANAADKKETVHPDTKTQAILKTTFSASKDGVDETSVTSYSYDIEKRTDWVSMMGGDGRRHDVPVEWDEYLPLEQTKSFFFSSEELADGKNVLAKRNGLCIFKSN